MSFAFDKNLFSSSYFAQIPPPKKVKTILPNKYKQVTTYLHGFIKSCELELRKKFDENVREWERERERVIARIQISFSWTKRSNERQKSFHFFLFPS